MQAALYGIIIQNSLLFYRIGIVKEAAGVRTTNSLVSVLLCLVFLMAACAMEKKNAAASHPPISPAVKTGTEAQKALERQDAYKQNEKAKNANVSSYKTVTEKYIFNDDRSDFAIKYPQITDMKDGERQRRINELIKSEAIPRCFFDRPADDKRMFTLPIDCKITWQSDRLLSIQYSGVGYVKGTPHPNHFFYTTNIDIGKVKKLVLRDLVKIDESFAEKLRDENIKTVSPHPGALSGKQVFIEHTPFNKLEDTVIILSNADGFDAKGRLPGGYSYFTPYSLGVGTGVPHPIGDHAEFEIRYEDLAKHIKGENEVWKDFLTGAGK